MISEQVSIKDILKEYNFTDKGDTIEIDVPLKEIFRNIKNSINKIIPLKQITYKSALEVVNQQLARTEQLDETCCTSLSDFYGQKPVLIKNGNNQAELNFPGVGKVAETKGRVTTIYVKKLEAFLYKI